MTLAGGRFGPSFKTEHTEKHWPSTKSTKDQHIPLPEISEMTEQEQQQEQIWLEQVVDDYVNGRIKFKGPRSIELCIYELELIDKECEVEDSMVECLESNQQYYDADYSYEDEAINTKIFLNTCSGTQTPLTFYKQISQLSKIL